MNNNGQAGNTLKIGDTERAPDIEVPFNAPPAPQMQPEQIPNSASPEQQTASVEQMPVQDTVPLNSPNMAMPPDSALTPAAQTIEEQNPEIAADGNKMEQSWVHQTEKVVNQYSNDPKTEEIEVNKLKADYMAKRFNRHLGDRN